MILSRAPLRITLGGGGTDIPSYYEKRCGFTITGAINKYVFVGAYEQFYPTISLKYSKIENVKRVDEIQHPLIREALRETNISNKIEITSLADVPSGTGLGSSGAFLVTLLNTLYAYKGLKRHKRELADLACRIELDKLKLHEGKQDKYACALGGIKMIEYLPNGLVSVMSFPDEDNLQSELKEKLMLFYTGKERSGTASDALKYQDEQCKINNNDMLAYLDEIKIIGYKTKQAFLSRNLDAFGKLLNKHWEIKKQYSPMATNDEANKCYRIALDNGALGGKIMGAGNGGFFMFYHSGSLTERWEFERIMADYDLIKMSFDFDNVGVTTIFSGC